VSIHTFESQFRVVIPCVEPVDEQGAIPMRRWHVFSQKVQKLPDATRRVRRFYGGFVTGTKNRCPSRVQHTRRRVLRIQARNMRIILRATSRIRDIPGAYVCS